ncbi:hypothetical protein CPB84DRAFT_1764435 [Gymnopilus junonius]|uniref:Uncharacterized protein n=1 Tax=Gymnopilus junonius TaxID=109634 RepID=A0A9P5TSS5_GYMJU|nr:hypothetical protein CPB84DRAFT_1764435 [Gymnopilus junonius]
MLLVGMPCHRSSLTILLQAIPAPPSSARLLCLNPHYIKPTCYLLNSSVGLEPAARAPSVLIPELTSYHWTLLLVRTHLINADMYSTRIYPQITRSSCHPNGSAFGIQPTKIEIRTIAVL